MADHQSQMHEKNQKAQKINYWRKYIFNTPALVIWIICILLIIAIYFIFANQETPYSKRAVLYAHVVGLSPEVSGRIIKIDENLKQQFVQKGAVLLQIDPKPYQLAVALAQDNVVTATQQVEELKTSVSQAENNLKAAEAELTKSQEYYNELAAAFKKGAISLQSMQQATADLGVKKANYAQIQNGLKKAKQELAYTINGVPVQIKKAQDALGLAQWNLDQTTLKAPANGYFENLYVHLGDYAEPGKTVIPFIMAGTFWIEGLASENSISKINLNQPVLIVLDLYPGHVFKGVVTSVGHGISVNEISSPNDGNLPAYNLDPSWLSPGQVFPFGVGFNGLTEGEIKLLNQYELRVGASAHMVVLNNHGWFWNSIAYVVIWIESWFAYF